MMRKFAIISVLSLLPLLVSGCGAASQVIAQKTTDPPATLYIFDPLNGNLPPQELMKTGTTIMPVSSQTLADATDRGPLVLSRFWDVSPGGAFIATVESPQPLGPSAAPGDITIMIRDNRAGIERSRFHPPFNPLPARLSQDGARLVVQHFPTGGAIPNEWTLLDTTHGQILATTRAEPSNDWQQDLIDPTAQRLYRFLTPGSAINTGPRPLVVIAYDLTTGNEIGRLPLPDILAGNWQTDRKVRDELVQAYLMPGVALSPDGQRLAILHANAEQVTLIATAQLSVERTVALKRSASLLNLLGLVPLRVSAKGGVAIGAERQVVFGADGQSLYLFGMERTLDDKESQTYHSFGLKRLDLKRDTMVADALPGRTINWALPSSDGRSVYVFGQKSGEGNSHLVLPNAPSLLQRLDAMTLAVQAEREFPGYRGGRLIR